MKHASPVSRLLRRFTDRVSIEEARLIANTLEEDPHISHWVRTAFEPGRQDQGVMLIRAAQVLRDELSNHAVASALERLAGDPKLLCAVICELGASSNVTGVNSVVPQFA
jgi:hypothetical protein